MTALVLLDDCFPHPVSAFRTLEYGRYLDEFPGAVAWTTGSAFGALQETRPVARVVAEHVERHPERRGRVRVYDPGRDRAAVVGRAAVLMFVANWIGFRDVLTARTAPFVMTLYPGGQFQRDDARSDAALRDLGGQPHLHTLIVTQRATLDYILDRRFVDPGKVTFLYGGVFPNHHRAPVSRRRFGLDKATLDLAFVAARYTPGGVDKGYDLFLESARLLLGEVADLRLHVVGPWTPDDGHLGALEGRLTFHGWLHSEDFPVFYAGIDAVVAPTRADVLVPGAFDGFPTGACIEAAMAGTAVFCTDPLRQNVAFRDGEELVVVEPDACSIAGAVAHRARDPVALARLAERGRAAFAEVFDLEAQMVPRLQAVRSAIEAC